MSGFDERRDSFEAKYAHEDKLSFELEARCSKIYGLWAAEKLGLEGPDAQTYASEVVDSNLDEPGFDDVLRKVRADFDAKGLDISDHVMRTQLDKALSAAKKTSSNKEGT